MGKETKTNTQDKETERNKECREDQKTSLTNVIKIFTDIRGDITSMKLK